MSSSDLALATTIGLAAQAAGIKRSICWAIIGVLGRSDPLAPMVLASLLDEDADTISMHLDAMRSVSVVDDEGGLSARYRSTMRSVKNDQGVKLDALRKQRQRARHKERERSQLSTDGSVLGHLGHEGKTAYKPVRYQTLGVPGTNDRCPRTTAPYVDAYKSIEKEEKKKVARRSENAPEGRDFQGILGSFRSQRAPGQSTRQVDLAPGGALLRGRSTSSR